ncbi:PA2169 family four-helix-bundle protein [Adhaeribacter sp. BT258]|uniref:PA2169 family four-helix-bundle protein n=1 Tax=Adhaeribacter terrigena TaxID=2793070 RepID=A0ABS1C2Q6_9BACT|nr:PA2169 family four-helix-bundle protein [Adhaeribacter terrigena]MBK0402845.1 PA2169 family four-helix-bundle protein [Adhaeribacter terrigena]
MEKRNEALKMINDLVETCKDGEKGYKTAAENVDNPQLKSELMRFAQQRADFRSELEGHVRSFGASPEDTSSIGGAVMEAAGAVHRGWINLKSAITGHDSKAILNECENGDAAAIETYEKVMKSPEIPVNVKTVIQKQHDEIEAAKAAVSSLKNTVM